MTSVQFSGIKGELGIINENTNQTFSKLGYDAILHATLTNDADGNHLDAFKYIANERTAFNPPQQMVSVFFKTDEGKIDYLHINPGHTARLIPLAGPLAAYAKALVQLLPLNLHGDVDQPNSEQPEEKKQPYINVLNNLLSDITDSEAIEDLQLAKDLLNYHGYNIDTNA